MPFENIQIQLIDTPPLSPDYVEPRLKDLIRGANLDNLRVYTKAPGKEVDHRVPFVMKPGRQDPQGFS